MQKWLEDEDLQKKYLSIRDSNFEGVRISCTVFLFECLARSGDASEKWMEGDRNAFRYAVAKRLDLFVSCDGHDALLQESLSKSDFMF